MRIGFDAKRLYNNFTGLGNYSRTLIDNLLAYHSEDEYYLYTPKVTHTPETEVYINNPSLITRHHSGLTSSYWRTFSIKKDLRRDNVDIYHGLSHELPVGIAKTGIKSVVTIHDIIYKTYPQMFTAIDRMIYDQKFRYSCQHADKIVAISESTKTDIIQEFGTSSEKIEVIYQAINPLFYTLQTKEEVDKQLAPYHLPQEFLLYVGTINRRKNLLNLVKAYALLPKDLQLPFVVIGQGRKYKQEVMDFIASQRLTARIRLIDGIRDTQTLQAFYQAATLFLFPSIYEGFGLPVTESILCKTPVLTSTTSSLPEAGGPGALYVDPISVEGIAEKMQTLLTDDTLRAQLVEKGYQYVHEKFAPATLTAQMHRLYQQL